METLKEEINNLIIYGGHMMMFVYANNICLRDKIMPSEIEISDDCLKIEGNTDFSLQFDNIDGISHVFIDEYDEYTLEFDENQKIVLIIEKQIA